MNDHRLDPVLWQRALEGEGGAATHEPFRRGIELAERAVRAVAKSGERWLDVGCGTGTLARRLADAGLRMVAGDRDPSMVALGTGARLALDAGRLPLASGSLDGVVAVSLLGLLERPEAFLAEAARVVRPSGRLVVTATNAASWSVWVGGALARLRRARVPEGGPARYVLHRPRRLAAACRAAGFEPERTTLYAFLGPRPPWSPAAIARSRARERTAPAEAGSIAARNFLLEAVRVPELSARPSAAPGPGPC